MFEFVLPGVELSGPIRFTATQRSPRWQKTLKGVAPLPRRMRCGSGGAKSRYAGEVPLREELIWGEVL